jgi:hypothetical protein
VPTYSQEDYERIANAIGKSMAEVLQHENEFEAAATWYRLNIPPANSERVSITELRKQRSENPKTLAERRKQRSKKPKTLAELRRKAKQIEATTRKLLRQLGVYHSREAPDGPGERDWVKATYTSAFGTPQTLSLSARTSTKSRLPENPAIEDRLPRETGRLCAGRRHSRKALSASLRSLSSCSR